jgi:chromosome segregation ATPase
MKKYLLVLAIPLILLSTGCNQKKIERLQFQKDSLTAVASAKEANLAEFVAAFNEIEANLDSIKQKEMVIDKSAKAGEVKGNRKEQIKSDIAYIYSLQVKNREKVAQLTSLLKKSNQHSADLQKMVDNLNKSIQEKDVQIASLTDELGKMNIQVKDLNVKVGDLTTNVNNLTTETQQKQKVIDEKTAALNTAYYVIGTTKELKDKKVITPTGGFIGIGRTKELTPDTDMGNFTKVDITQLNEIPIMKKSAKIITTHPNGSYRVDGNKTADKLVILNPTDFWSKSKVLVIVVK